MQARVDESQPLVRPLEYGLLAIMATAAPLVRPIVSNQNQYLAHAIDVGQSGLRQDWLLGTADPYPLFTVTARALLELGGTAGLVVLAWVGTFVGLIGTYLLSQVLFPGLRRSTYLAAVLATIATLSVVWSSVPIVRGVAAFTGLAGQYLLGGYAQPSMFGVLILVALPLWLRAVGIAGSSPSITTVLAASALSALACAFHPTYLVCVFIGMLAAFAVDIHRWRWTRLAAYVGVGSFIFASASIVNPGVMLSMARPGSEADARAAYRFAFERIPHHTLIGEWPVSGWAVVGAVLICVWVLWRRGQRRMAIWIGIVLAIALSSAIVTDLTRNTSLALAFPWRITVILMPLAVVVLATEISQRLFEVRGRLCMVFVVAGSILLGTLGFAATMRSRPPSEWDPMVELTRAAGVGGVGLIPFALDAENVRLNAQVALYVDWKSPPYVGADLQEWWRRVDRVREFEEQPESFCYVAWAEDIDWIVMENPRSVPSCISSWDQVKQAGSDLTLYKRE